MVSTKSLEYYKVLTTLLSDVQTLHSNVFTSSALRKTLKKVESRAVCEGRGFLTKSLPRLGKGLDKALACHEPLDAAKYGFKPLPNSKLPRFLGELFQQVLGHDGVVLPNADVTCVISLRQVFGLFYKLELPYDTKLEQDVIDKFERTENEIQHHSQNFRLAAEALDPTARSRWAIKPNSGLAVIREARKNLHRLFQNFDCRNIFPRHGPGAVSTGERLEGKYRWTCIPKRITECYPVDEYFYSSMGHVCDSITEINSMKDCELPARVILVPKDSRGPRLISCEPLAFQWIQQGLGTAIVAHVEKHPLTRENVRFTDQEPNRMASLLGSRDGKYSTLDLNEASDRVTTGLVHLLFPEPLLTALMASRSLGTTLPSGKYLELNKFAPMGSALCFPVLALTIWSLLDAAIGKLDTDARKSIYVYGDDVIVPTHWAEHAMSILESFGLKINRDKSCTKGLFRESCGLDAFKGREVTPVRLRTPWSPFRCPDVYTSWISYANSLYDRQYYNCYDYIVGRLIEVYDSIPSDDYGLSVPSLRVVPEKCKEPRSRSNPRLQRREFYVYSAVPIKTTREIDGWRMLLRFFTEANSSYELRRTIHPSTNKEGAPATNFGEPFSVRQYTYRKRTKLRKVWAARSKP